ncbi:hypothetical protein [Streptomyces bacillaris]|uniref:hypothetical protein n=1 Tax=Streptomyces bacillaris TaxID=68179 RepID=UPI0038163FAC
MKAAESSAAPEGRGRRDPVVAQRARLAATSVTRGVMWAILTISLLGTAVTAPYLPSPWGRPIVVLSVVGGLGCGIVAFYCLFIAFMAGLGLLLGAVPDRPRTRPEATARGDGS